MARELRVVSISGLVLVAALALALGLIATQTVTLWTPLAHHGATSVQQPLVAPPATAQPRSSSTSSNAPPAQAPAPAQGAPVSEPARPADRCQAAIQQTGRAIPMCAPLAPQP